MKANDRQPEALYAELGDASMVLVLSPATSTVTEDACWSLLSAHPPARSNVLAITFDTPPDVWLRDWEENVGVRPANLGIISVGDTVRSAAPEHPVGTTNAPVVQTVSNPADLTGMGMRISSYLDRWRDDNRLVVCFDSLTILLQYVDVRQVFQFLHVYSKRFPATGVVGHFHLDPATQDDRSIATLSIIFDAVLERTDDEWTVRRV